MPKTRASTGQGESSSLNTRAFHGLRELIDREVLPAGLVLLEGPIAAYFNMSRVPVRKALADLAAVGLLCKFDGRGYLVDPEQRKPAPLRLPFRSFDLPERPANDFVRRRGYEWQRLERDLAGELLGRLLFGAYQIREAALCARYGISRTVVREALNHLMSRGLIEKDPRSHWICGPFTARANDEQYRMRMILEPAALAESCEGGAPPGLGRMLARLDEIESRSRLRTASGVAELENDMHTLLVGRCKNDRLRAAIAQNQLCLSVSRTFFDWFGVDEGEAMFSEHRKVLTALIAHEWASAVSAMKAHLAAARERSRARLKVLAVIEEPTLPDFLVRIQ